MSARQLLLQAIDEIKGPEVRAEVESGDGWTDSLDSLDLLEILACFDDKVGAPTDPLQLSDSLKDFDALTARLDELHGLT